MKRAPAFTLALLLALLAGCSPVPAPQDGAGTPDETSTTGSGPSPEADPATGEATLSDATETACLPVAEPDRRPLGRLEFTAVTEGLCEAVAPAEEFFLTFAFPPGLPEEAVRSSLEVSGGEVTQLDISGGEYLLVYLGPAEPGTETTVRVRGPVGEGGTPADLGFRLRREASPTVEVDVQVGDDPWRPHQPGEYLEPGPVRVRLAFSHPVAADQVEWRFQGVLEAVKDRDAIPHQLSWTDPRTLVVELPEPPPALYVELGYIEDDRGLRTRSGILNLHVGTPPRLTALDPATGQEEVLGPAPVDIRWASASPDGRWVVLEATQPDSTSGTDVWLVETATGEAMKTDLQESPYSPGYIWFPDRLVVAGWTELQEWDLTRHERRVLPAEASYAGPLSPDGRYLAGRVLHMDREDPETWLAPLTVAVYDLATHTERLYPEVGNFWVPHRGGGVPVSVPMRWPDGGRSLYVLQHYPGPTPADSETYWAVLDLETGVLTPAEDYSADPFDYERAEPHPVSNASGWAFLSAGWGAVILISPGGQEVAGGDGLPLAWMPDGRLLLVRWPDYPYLRYTGL